MDLGSSTKEMKDIYVDGTAFLDAIDFGGTALSLPGSVGSTGQVLVKADGSNALEWTSTAGGTTLTGLGVNATAAELNIMDGSATVQSTVTLAGTDGVVISDGDVMKQALMSDIKTYIGGPETAQVIASSSTDTATELTIGKIKVRIDDGYIQAKGNGQSVTLGMYAEVFTGGSAAWNDYGGVYKVGSESGYVFSDGTWRDLIEETTRTSETYADIRTYGKIVVEMYETDYSAPHTNNYYKITVWKGGWEKFTLEESIILMRIKLIKINHENLTLF